MRSRNVVPFTRSGRYKYLDANASHARIFSGWRKLPSFETLKLLERVILEDILMGFNKAEGNEVRLTGNQISKRYSVHHNTARLAIIALEERGWIARIGLAPGPTGQAGGLYEILCLSPEGQRVAGPYMNWTPARKNCRTSSSDGPN